MAKKPRPTKGVPEEVFQRELFKYLERKESNPNALRNQAHFTYNGIQYTFERGNGPYHSGYQIKTSSGQAAKEAAKKLSDNQTPPTTIERLMLQSLYDIAAKRNLLEGRKGNQRLEIGHLRPRARGGPHLPWNTRLQERGENLRQSADINYTKYQYEPLLPQGLQNLLDITNSNDNGFTKAAKVAEEVGPPVVSMAATVFNNLNETVAANNGGEDIFDAIPNGSAKERKEKNKKINGDYVKNNGHNGNGNGHTITNEIDYIAKKFSNGQLPYNGD